MSASFINAGRGRVASIALICAVWTLAGMILGAQTCIALSQRGEPVAWIRILAIWLAWGYLWALLTPLACKLADRFPIAQPRALRAVVLHCTAGLMFAGVNLALFAVLAPAVHAASLRPSWGQTFLQLLGSAFVLNVPVYWLIIGVAHAVRLGHQNREQERRALKLEAQLAEARLLALRAQLEPHFLFNALNTIAVLMREDLDAANRVLVLLGSLLRRALETPTAPEIELGQELAFLEAYLELEQVRFADKLSYCVDVPPELRAARVPSLILQPLVENAVRHGLRERKTNGRIEVAAALHEGMLQLTVCDNGPGLAPDTAIGVGLANTRSRLELLYRERHSFELCAAVGGGLLVRIAIPFASGAHQARVAA